MKLDNEYKRVIEVSNILKDAPKSEINKRIRDI